jgi:hypothetical protein
MLEIIGVHLPAEVFGGMSVEALMRLGSQVVDARDRAEKGSCVAAVLPALGELITDEPRWRYPGEYGSGYGTARLRVWETSDGHLAVVTETGDGISVTNAARAIWRVLAGRFPGALTVIEQWPAGQSPETGEHYDLMQAPPGTAPGWSRLWPAHPEHPQAAVYVAWMARWGAQIRETAGRFFSGDPVRQARAYLLTDEAAAAAIAGQAAFPALDEVSRRAVDQGGADQR